MALLKTYEIESGVSGSYWKITKIEIDFVRKISHVYIYMYLNKEARLENRDPLTVKDFEWIGDDFPFSDIKEDIRVMAYDKLKTDNLFTDAETV